MENHFFGYPDHDENEEESTNYEDALRNRQSMIKFKDVEDEDELEREVRNESSLILSICWKTRTVMFPLLFLNARNDSFYL